jgi:DNA-binding MarR family transcriptional regulator
LSGPLSCTDGEAAGAIVVELFPFTELSIASRLESVGISLLSEWDVLIFMYRHRATLMSARQIALLLGYETPLVRSALERLLREKLIKRSRIVRGVRFYQILPPTDAEREHHLQQLASLSESRAGRLLLRKRLKAVGTESGLECQK